MSNTDGYDTSAKGKRNDIASARDKYKEKKIGLKECVQSSER